MLIAFAEAADEATAISPIQEPVATDRLSQMKEAVLMFFTSKKHVGCSVVDAQRFVAAAAAGEGGSHDQREADLVAELY